MFNLGGGYMSILYCKRCGKQMSSRAGFCVSCGEKITEDCESDISKDDVTPEKTENEEPEINVSEKWRNFLWH